jgi:hypothetical protein
MGTVPRLLTGAVLGVALLLPHPSVASGPTGASASAVARVQTLVLVRTTTGPAWYHLGIEAALSPAAPHALDAAVTARVDGGRLRRAGSLGAFAFAYDGDVTVKAASTTVRLCQPLGGCVVNRVLAYSTAVESRDSGGPGVDNRLYVVEEGPARVTFRGKGWALRRVPLSYRWVGSDAADATGVFTGANSVEAFEHAALRGGRYGSIATGAPPCSTATAGVGAAPVPRGVGTATLTGGQHTQSLTCPENIGAPYLTGVAQRATQWSLDGPVVGDSTQLNVPLFVLDLPARP